MTLLFGFFVMLLSFSKIDVHAFEKAKKETTKLFGGEYQKPTQKLEDAVKEQFQLQGMTDKAIFNELESGIALNSVLKKSLGLDIFDTLLTVLSIRYKSSTLIFSFIFSFSNLCCC